MVSQASGQQPLWKDKDGSSYCTPQESTLCFSRSCSFPPVILGGGAVVRHRAEKKPAWRYTGQGLGNKCLVWPSPGHRWRLARDQSWEPLSQPSCRLTRML